MIPGVEFDFGGGRVYLVPPLSLGALELLQDQLAALPTMAGTDPVAVRTITDVALLALRRNYPEITRQEVGELLDVGNMGEVYECVMDVTGIKRRAQQAEREGNAPAKSPKDGATSSPASAPTPAGVGTTSAST